MGEVRFGWRHRWSEDEPWGHRGGEPFKWRDVKWKALRWSMHGRFKLLPGALAGTEKGRTEGKGERGHRVRRTGLQGSLKNVLL